MPDTRFSLAAVLLLSSACLDAAPPPQAGTSRREVNVPVIWQNTVGVNTTGASNNGLVKTASQNSWNAGAVSTQTIGGHGWVRFGVATGETNTFRMAGLSRVNTTDEDDQSYEDIDYGIMLTATSGVSIYESGSLVTTAGTYSDTDVFYVEATPTQIIYRKNAPPNDVVLHTTDIDPDTDPDVFPLQVDTSLKTSSPASTIGNVVINEDPKVHVAVQGGFFADDLRCGTGDAISINGSAFFQYNLEDADYDTAAEFENTDPIDVRDNLLDYAATHGIPNPETETRIIIMDIEKESHPSDLWDHLDEYDEIVEGLKRRIIGTRMAFPNAKLGLYGTLVPDADGDDTADIFEARLAALEDAAADGLFGDLTWNSQLYSGVDYLVPVLYIRFGCDSSDCEGGLSTGYNAIGAYTELGIEASRSLADLPLLPLLTIRVRNGFSGYHLDLLRDLEVPNPDPDDPFAGNLTVQMDAFRAADPPVDDVLLWVEGNDGQVLWEENNGPSGNCIVGISGDCWTVDDYTCNM